MSVGLARGGGEGGVRSGKGPELGSTGVTWAGGRTGGFPGGDASIVKRSRGVKSVRMGECHCIWGLWEIRLPGI